MRSDPPASSIPRLRREVVAYVAIAFAITWVLIGSIVVFDLPEFPLVLPGIWGPTLAAVILTAALRGRAGLKRFLARVAIVRVGWRWYAFVLLGFPAIAAIGLAAWSVVSGRPLEIAAPSLGALVPVLVFQLLVPGLGEEFGWRGYALPRLERIRTPLVASLVLGLVHWAWHLPTFWLGQGIHNVPAVWSIAYVLPWTILFTWVYNHTRGSVLVAVLFHALHGVTLSAVPFLPPQDAVPLTPDLLVSVGLPDGLLGPYVAVTAIYWILAGIVVAGGFGGLGAPPPFEHDGAPREADPAVG